MFIFKSCQTLSKVHRRLFPSLRSICWNFPLFFSCTLLAISFHKSCCVLYQSYKTHQHVPQVAAEHLDLTSLKNSVLLLLLLSLWPQNDSNPVFWEKRGSDLTPCLCCAHLSCEELEFSYCCPKPILILFPVFLQSTKLMDAFWRFCRRSDCWNESFVLRGRHGAGATVVSACAVSLGSDLTSMLSVLLPRWDLIPANVPNGRSDSWKPADDPCCWGGVWSGNPRAVWGCGAVRSSLACLRAMCHGELSGLATLGIPGKLILFSAGLQGVEWLQMLPPDWSWEFEGQLNLLMLVLWCGVWEIVMRHEAEQLARLLLEWLRSADSS